MPWSRENIDLATDLGRIFAEGLMGRMSMYLEDTEREDRRKAQLCKVCFYLRDSIGGRAFTPYRCKMCGKEYMHSNTDVPTLCPDCAEKHELCMRCGGRFD